MGAGPEDKIRAHDARDARLISARRFDELVAGYYEIIVQRCWLKVRDRSDAYEVAGNVVVRLLYQLGRGAGFSAPFRVVVHKRIDWEVKSFFARRRKERLRYVRLDEAEEPWREEDSLLAILDRDEVEGLLDRIPERDREILELVYLEGLPITRAAERLGITRNAADQRLFRARQRLKDLVGE
jgi:RNA polymerase sigma-70 factor (ECF subfamily)